MLERRTLLGLLGAAPAAFALPARAANTPVRIGVQPVESAGQTFYAKDLGWFDQAGLDVEITTLSNGGALVAAVISGALDVGLSAVGPIAQGYVKGLGVKIIAPAGMSLSTAPTDVTMVALDSPIKTAADLTGKTIAVNGLGNVLMNATQAWLDKNGGDSKSVKWLELPFPSMAAALAAHRVDAATLAEPYVSDAKSVARPLASPMDAIARTIPATTWFANGTWLQTQPAVAGKVVDVLRRAAIWANGHSKEAADILLKYTPIKASTLAVMTRSTFGVDIVPSQIQALIDAGVKYNSVDHEITAAELIWKAPKA
ncbi:MAG TPA: ABC transporter substrate-binding protein [Candidatus Lustribacter sp.]|jgi:NitT/TauT family transport system substrate-binding protein|nr:ABC transporter substrate-binding protein [Candidatus Lustribacter sp.]